MTESVYSWMRGIACYYLLYSIVMNLISDKQYQAYIKSFMGMILVVIILTPIFQLFRSDLDISDVLLVKHMQQEWQRMQEKTIENPGKTDVYVLEACKEQMEEQIGTMAEKYGLQAKDIELELTYEEEIILQRIAITLEPYTERGQVEALKEDLSDVYGIDQSHISIDIR